LIQADIGFVTNWLERQDLVVNREFPNNVLIRFSIDTEIHEVEANGERHLGTVSDPQFPAALARIVVGVVSLKNFMPHSSAVLPPPGAVIDLASCQDAATPFGGLIPLLNLIKGDIPRRGAPSMHRRQQNSQTTPRDVGSSADNFEQRRDCACRQQRHSRREFR
jgi:hypothetical protein